MIGAWWRKNVIEKVHAAAYSGRFTIKVLLSVPPRAHSRLLYRHRPDPVASACMLSCCSNTATLINALWYKHYGYMHDPGVLSLVEMVCV